MNKHTFDNPLIPAEHKITASVSLASPRFGTLKLILINGKRSS